MIGDTVNVAARVEQLTKTIGDAILLTQRSVDALTSRPAELTGRGSHALKGKSATVQVFALRPNSAVPQRLRYLSKTLPARELVAALEAVHAGETVVSDIPPRARSAVGLDWPGRGEGLSDREAEILALITQGKSNAEIATLTYLSPNTVKSYIRSIYRKIEVGSRTQAVLWGVEHGFKPDHHRIEHWRGGP